MFGFDRTGVTTTVSAQSGICAVVSGDMRHYDDSNRDAEVTAYPCSSDDQKSVCCRRAGRKFRACRRCARDKESESGRRHDGITRDECQGAVTMAVLESCYASRAVAERKHHTLVQEWEFSMVAVMSPKSGSVVAAGCMSTRYFPGDVL